METTLAPHHNNRIVWVLEFDDPNVLEFSASIADLFEKDSNKPIIINIMSYGGSVHGLLAMLDIMDSYRAMGGEGFSFITHGIGRAMSAGALLLAYGDYRFASPRCSIMLHNMVAGTGWGVSHPDSTVEYEYQDNLNESIIDILFQRSSVNCKTELKEIIDRNLYLTPTQSQELGIIDGIGVPSMVDSSYTELLVSQEPEQPKKTVTKKKKKKKTAKKKGGKK